MYRLQHGFPHYALCCVTPHTALSAVSLPTPGEHLSGIFFNAIPKSGHWKCFTSHPTSVSAPVTLDSQSVFSQAPLSDLRSDASRAKGRYRPLSDATCSCCSVSTVVQTHSVQLYRHTAYSCTDTERTVEQTHSLQLYRHTAYSCTDTQPTVVQTHSVQLYRHTAYSCTDTQRTVVQTHSVCRATDRALTGKLGEANIYRAGLR